MLCVHDVSGSMLTRSPEEVKMSRGRGGALPNNCNKQTHILLLSLLREKRYDYPVGMRYNSTKFFAAKAWVAIGQAKLTSSNKADTDLNYVLHLSLMHLLPPSSGKAKTT